MYTKSCWNIHYKQLCLVEGDVPEVTELIFGESEDVKWCVCACMCVFVHARVWVWDRWNCLNKNKVQTFI